MSGSTLKITTIVNNNNQSIEKNFMESNKEGLFKSKSLKRIHILINETTYTLCWDKLSLIYWLKHWLKELSNTS